MTGVLIAHAGATWFMVGLIWMVQTVHYPLFALVGGGAFTSYENEHTWRIGRLLALPAGVEAITAVALLANPPEGVSTWLVWLSALLLGGLWLTTLVVQVPIHRGLSDAKSAAAINRLVATNWLRTLGWSLRGLMALLILAPAI